MSVERAEQRLKLVIKWLPLEVATCYILLMGFWFLRSDWLLQISPTRQAVQQSLHSYLAVLSTVFAGAGIYVLLQSYMRTLRAAQELVSERDQIFRLVVTAIQDHAIITTDRTGRILNWNEGASEVFKFQAAEVMGKDLKDLNFPETAQRPEISRHSLVHKQHRRRWLKRKDGESFLADITITPLYNDIDVHQGHAWVIRDLTEPHRAYEQMRELFHVIDSTAELILLQDLGGVIRYMNKGGERVLGKGQEQAVRMSVQALLFNQNESLYAQATDQIHTYGSWRGNVFIHQELG